MEYWASKRCAWCCYLVSLCVTVLLRHPVMRTNIRLETPKPLAPAWQILATKLLLQLPLLLQLWLLLLLQLLRLQHPERLLHRQGLLLHKHRHRHRKHSMRLLLQRLYLLGCRGEERGKVLGEDFCGARMRLQPETLCRHGSDPPTSPPPRDPGTHKPKQPPKKK